MWIVVLIIADIILYVFVVYCNYEYTTSSLHMVHRAFWLPTSGVNTNGAAAKVMIFDGLGKKVRPGTWEDKSRLAGVPKKSLSKNKKSAVTPHL